MGIKINKKLSKKEIYYLYKLEDWVSKHKDVFNKDENGNSPWWYTQNCLGSMGILDWEVLSEIYKNYN